MPGNLYMEVTIELEDQTYRLATNPNTTRLEGKTIPQPYRRRIDQALRSVGENIRLLRADQVDSGA